MTATSTFARFPPRLQEAIVSRLGFSSLRPVQEQAGAALLDGNNAVILAPTAGGKTEASMFPSLANLLRDEPAGVGLVYIAPIKALLNNQADRFVTYTEMVGLRSFVWHGDTKATAKNKFVDVVELAQDASTLAHGKKTLFFCQSRSLTESVAEKLRDRGIDVFVHHSSVSREEREVAEASFEHGSNACIVCTSTLELGIDVGDLDQVFQANAPTTVSSFLQRMGRTGRRAGQRANTTFFCEDPEVVLQAVGIVELAKQHWVESVPPQNRCWPVMVHQILALCLQFGAVSRERLWEWLSAIPDFAGITATEFGGLVDHMVGENYLFLSGGLLSMGDETERVFGHKNFMELYAVFTTPQLYAVKTEAGHALGSLEQAFVDKLVEQMSSFLLAGRAWTVAHVNHEERTVRVAEAPRGKKPSWGGFAPQILGFELCQAIAGVIKGEGPVGYIDQPSQAALDELRNDLGPLLRREGRSIQVDPDRALWWTFAGGRSNHTLRYALEILEDWKVTPDNFRIRVEGDGVGHKTLGDAIDKMSEPGFWQDPDTQRRLLGKLPEYRLSKFQRAMPEAACLEMIGRYMLDIGGAERFLAGTAA